jgi:DNA-binding CsgD family transcriptional regulator
MPLEDLDIAIAALTRLRATLAARPLPAPRNSTADPTPREAEVLELIQQGLSRAAVAQKLGLHVSRVTQLVASLRSRGVVVPGGARRGAALRTLAVLRSRHEAAQKAYRAACDWLDDEDRERCRIQAREAKAAYEKALGTVMGPAV